MYTILFYEYKKITIALYNNTAQQSFNDWFDNRILFRVRIQGYNTSHIF